jgi:hypothetical protein
VLALKKEARDGKEGGWRFLGEKECCLYMGSGFLGTRVLS